MKNATYLFEGQNGFHHSESRWSTIAQLAFIWMGKNEKSINVFHTTYEDKTSQEWLQERGEQIAFTGWNSANTIIEGKLSMNLFELEDVEKWSKDFDNLKPDIVHIHNEKIVIIEVKTIGASVKSNIKLYRRLAECLGKKCELYYLLSYGHESTADWKHLNEDNANILLWEELFNNIIDSELAKYIHPDLKHYTLMPEWLQDRHKMSI